MSKKQRNVFSQIPPIRSVDKMYNLSTILPPKRLQFASDGDDGSVISSLASPPVHRNMSAVQAQVREATGTQFPIVTLAETINAELDSAFSEPTGTTESSAQKMCPAEQKYVKNDNSKQILLAMAIGIQHEGVPLVDLNDTLFSPKKKMPSSKAVKRTRPTVPQLIVEIKERKQLLKDTSKTPTQKKVDWYVKWLVNNPRKEKADVQFLVTHVQTFKEHINNVTDTVPQGSPQWHGDIPWLRLIHAILDEDAIRASFVKSMQPLSKQELDEKKKRRVG